MKPFCQSSIKDLFRVNKSKILNLKNISVIFLILLLALTLRLYQLDKYTLWYDEADVVLNKWGADKLYSFTRLFDKDFLVRNMDYLTVYCYGFIYFWQELFGKTEFILRLPSVIFAILTIIFIFILGKRFFGIRSGYLVSFLLAISPLSIYHSQEVRPYTGIGFFTLIGAYSLLMILEDSGKKYSIIYIISNVLNVYFHSVATFVLISFIIFVMLKIKTYRHLARSLILIHLIIVILIVPVLLSLFAKLNFVVNNKLNPDLSFIEYPFWGAKANLKQLAFTLKNFSTGYNVNYFGIGKTGALIYFILFLLGFLKVRKQTAGQLFLSCLLIPVLTLFFASQFRSCYVDRYLFPVLSFYLLFISLGLESFNRSKIYLFLLSSVVCLNSLGLLNYYRDYLPEYTMQYVAMGEKQDIRKIIDTIVVNYRKGDRILHTCKNTIFPLKFYMRRIFLDPYLLNEVNRGTRVFIDIHSKGNKLLAYDYDLLYPAAIVLENEYKIAQLTQHDRIWLISSNWHFSAVDKKDSKTIRIIKQAFSEIKKVEAIGARLYLFERNQDPEI